jgi:hypothetical protein
MDDASAVAAPGTHLGQENHARQSTVSSKTVTGSTRHLFGTGKSRQAKHRFLQDTNRTTPSERSCRTAMKLSGHQPNFLTRWYDTVGKKCPQSWKHRTQVFHDACHSYISNLQDMHHVTGLVTSHKIATITQFSLDNIFHASWRTMFRITLFLPLLNVYIQVFPSLAICNLYACLLVALAVGGERIVYT